MRLASALMILALAPAVADAGVRSHLNHKHHHHGREEPAESTPAPVSDTPGPVWTASRTRR